MIYRIYAGCTEYTDAVAVLDECFEYYTVIKTHGRYRGRDAKESLIVEISDKTPCYVEDPYLTAVEIAARNLSTICKQDCVLIGGIQEPSVQFIRTSR